MGAIESIRELLGLDSGDEDEPTGPTFEERQVSPLAEAQFGYRGEYRFDADEGETVIERRFDVFLADDGDSAPRVEITELRRVDGERVGDDETTDLQTDVDPGLGEMRLKNAVASVLEEWHREQDPRPEEARDGSSAGAAGSDGSAAG